MTRGLTLGEADWVAQRFHETYERLAPNYNYETRPETARPWHDVPPENKALMIDTIIHLFAFDEHNVLVMVDHPVTTLPLVGGEQL